MSNNPTYREEWSTLAQLAQNMPHLNDLFAKNPKRAEKYSVELGDLYFDYSKHKIDDEVLDNLLSLARKSGLENKSDAMFSGAFINVTENNAALHTALRAGTTSTVQVSGEHVQKHIHTTLKAIENLSQKIRDGAYLGLTGKPIKHILSLGIGGSDLGPRMIYKALKQDDDPVEVHFVANIDGDEIKSALQQCDPETTLIIVISKSFQTQETLTNAITARNWLRDALGKEKDISNHLLAVSSNVKLAQEFGIKPDNIYPIWNWVNGRFSLWSAVGVSLAIGIGFDKFKDLLHGAQNADEHFRTAPLENNIPVLMAVLGVWNRNFLNSAQHVILPYVQKLSCLPSYLQQLSMESNGKSVDLEGNDITEYETASVLFGDAGTNGQHSYYQFLHQGTDIIPCDFIGVINPDHAHQNHHDLLMGHMLAQGQAMMQGKRSPDNPHRECKGDRPSSTILLDKLTPHALGMLVALYEHKIFVQGIIWNINSFDQFGVELGKGMAKEIEKHNFDALDPSTRALYSRIHKDTK